MAETPGARAQTGAAPRVAAARALARLVGDGESLDDALGVVLPGLGQRERTLARALAYGVARWYLRLDAVARELLARPLRRRDLDVHCLVLIGIFQLLYMRVPDHAAVNETVGAARHLGKGWAARVINGVLRNLRRRQDEVLTKVDGADTARLAHPGWLLAHYRRDWPAHWEAIAEAGNAHPPMTLRVNTGQVDREGYLAQLREAALPAHAVDEVATAITLAEPVEVNALPGFAAGAVSVQDAAAQLAAPCLALGPGQRVLDACAAPGGKAGHILETEPGLDELVAVDIAPHRLQRVEENLARLGLSAKLIAGDAADPSQWWDGRAFDRILVDAPCSGTGVIRRHPDIKLLRREADIETLVARQRRLLAALWPLLAPGGMLLYVTCSVLERENAAMLGAFADSQGRARQRALAFELGHTRGLGRQILPGEAGMDGFYYARLEKV